MQTHDHHSPHEREAATRKPPAPETIDQSPVELAGKIGNSAMQRVAASRELQRSPAAAGLITGGTLARKGGAQEEDAPLEPEADAPGGVAAPAEAAPPEAGQGT